MPRYRFLCEYRGTDFSGWQRQPKDVSVQQVLEEALSKCLRAPIDILGSGRTDAGVHAAGVVLSMKLLVRRDEWTTDPLGVAIADSINQHLPHDRIRAFGCIKVC